MKPLGYTFLLKHFDIQLPRLGRDLYHGKGNRDKNQDYGSIKCKVLAASKKYPDSIPAHVEVAIKYQGIRLPYLAMVFERLDVDELTHYIAAKQNSKIRRAIWYLYEWYTEKLLNLKPLGKTPYTELMDSTFYFTRQDGEKCARTKIVNNMLGNRNCCPTVRKTRAINEIDFEGTIETAESKLSNINQLVNTEQLGRSLNYLYLKETKSSTEIENEDSNQNKTTRFFQVLRAAGSIPLSKHRLLTVQNQIVPSNKSDTDYRDEEIWVGENVRTMGGTYENFHYIGPKWQKVPDLMTGLLEMHEQLMLEPQLPTLVHAAIVSFMFVYIHPFSDGNGRTHRYLIHDIIKSRRSRDDFIVPVSSAILNNMDRYDKVLEQVSKPVMALLQYDYDENSGTISLENDINYMYQFPDLTPHVLFLNDMMDVAINHELIEEILYILTFDKIKQWLNKQFDLSEKVLSNYVNWLMQNNGKFATRKHKQVAKHHSEKDIEEMHKFAIEALAHNQIILAELKGK